MAYDPWAGYNQGMQNLGQSFDDIRTQQREAPLKALQLRILQQKEQEGQIGLDEAARTAADKLALRTKLANVQPVTETTGGYSQDTSPQTSRAAELMRNGTGMIPNTTPSPALLATLRDNVSQNPEIAAMNGAASRLQGYDQSQAIQDSAANGAAIIQPNTATGVEVPQQTVTTKTEAQQRMEILLDHAMKTGDYDAATKSVNLESVLAKRKAEMESSGGDMTAYVKAQMDLTASKDLLNTISPLMQKGEAGRQLAQRYLEAAKKAAPGNTMLQNANLDDFAVTNGAPVQAVRDPQTGQILGHYIMNPTKGEMEFKQSNAAEVANTDFGTFKNGFKQENPKATDADVSRAWDAKKLELAKAQRQVIVNNPTGGTGGGGDDDVNAWAKAIKEGRANLQDVPNRGTVRSRVVKALEGEGGVDYAANKAENSAYGATVTQQQKQIGAMGSFVKNIDKQVNRFNKISSDIASFDTRLLNVPLRQLRGRVAGSPNQAKIDMYLTEISSETGKLASGATGSVAELSQSAREKWEKIHDPNLSMHDLIDLLNETRHAGQMRMESAKEQLTETRKARRNKPAAGAASIQDAAIAEMKRRGL